MMSKQAEITQVDSFSQLPFTRPAAQNPAKSTNSAPIRLFGIDFPPETEHNDTKKSKSSLGEDTTAAAPASAISVNRKFECHYCCRKFPTSQALGGHQNAHKRERQNAKRAHMAAAHGHHPNYVTEGQVYGLLNYHQLGAPPPMPSYYPSWSSSRFYGGPGSVSQPITSSPIPGVWRLPGHGSTIASFDDPVQREKRLEMAPLFKGEELKDICVNDIKVGSGFGSSSSSTCCSASPKERGRIAAMAGVKDGLSLDLHL